MLRNKQLLFVTCHQWDNESIQEAEAAFPRACLCVYFSNDQINESRVNGCLASVLDSAAVVRYFDISSWLHNKIRQIFRWATETPHTLRQLCDPTQKKRGERKSETQLGDDEIVQSAFWTSVKWTLFVVLSKSCVPRLNVSLLLHREILTGDPNGFQETKPFSDPCHALPWPMWGGAQPGNCSLNCHSADNLTQYLPQLSSVGGATPAAFL